MNPAPATKASPLTPTLSPVPGERGEGRSPYCLSYTAVAVSPAIFGSVPTV